MNGFDWLRRLLKNQRGNVLIVTAATMPLVIGAGAVGLDTIQMGIRRRSGEGRRHRSAN
jgi:hypothetical protein